MTHKILLLACFAVACGNSAPAQAGGCPTGTVLKDGSCVPPDDSPSPSTASTETDEQREARQESRLAQTPADTSTPSSSGPKVAYDKEGTDPILKRAALQAKKNCGSATDEDGKATGPWGPVKVSITLGRNGHTKQVTIPAPFDGKPVGNCLIKAFSNLTFPPYAAPSDVIVDWDVDVAQPKK